MTAQLSREELEILAFNGVTHTERALARMLLSGMDSDKKLRDFAASQTSLGADIELALAGSLHELYLGDDTAPPAPVVVPNKWPEKLTWSHHDDMTQAEVLAWNNAIDACRAAMLKGENHEQ